MPKSIRAGLALWALAALLASACTPTPVNPTAVPASAQPPATVPPPVDGIYPCPTCRPTIPVPPMWQEVAIDVEGMQLRGMYWTPGYVPAPAVLLLHQNGGRKEDYSALSQGLLKGGFAVLAIDMRGFGATGGQPDWSKAQQDIPQVIDWLAREARVNSDRLGIVGASVGSSLALTTAAQNSRVKGVVLLSPGLDYMGIQTEPAAGKYQGALMLVSSAEDGPAAAAVPRLADAHPGDEKITGLNNAGHGTAMLQAQPSLIGDIVEWLKATL
jgi:dienelactone hydrolase